MNLFPFLHTSIYRLKKTFTILKYRGSQDFAISQALAPNCWIFEFFDPDCSKVFGTWIFRLTVCRICKRTILKLPNLNIFTLSSLSSCSKSINRTRVICQKEKKNKKTTKIVIRKIAIE